MRRWGLWLGLLACACDAAPEAPGAEAGLDAQAGADAQGAVDAAPSPDATLAPDAEQPDAEADAALPDAEADAALPDAEPPDAAPPEGPAVYRDDRLVSPLTPHVQAHLKAVLARAPRQDDVFAKVGASSTVSRSFLHCFAGPHVDLDGRDLGETVAFFGAGDAAGGDPYTRESRTATVGWSAGRALAGPLDAEVAAIDPRFAVVMYGTNDIEGRNIDRYAGNMLTLVEGLLDQGVIPVLSSIMPRDDNPESDAWVAPYNAVVRGVAQAHQVPFVDLHQVLLPLPDHGLGRDRLHCSTYRVAGAARACVFTDAGLRHGYNWRNLLTLEALDRLRRHVLEDAPAPDAPEPLRPSAGTPADPVPITALPFTDLRDTTTAPSAVFDAYPRCDTGQDESGPEFVYRLDLAAPTTVRAFVLDRGDVDVDLHLLGDQPHPDRCVARDHREITASLDAGTWHFVVDTFVSRAGPRAGAFLFVVVAESP